MFTSVADEALAIFTETPIHVNYSLEQKSKSARSSGSPLEILEIYSPTPAWFKIAHTSDHVLRRTWDSQKGTQIMSMAYQGFTKGNTDHVHGVPGIHKREHGSCPWRTWDSQKGTQIMSMAYLGFTKWNTDHVQDVPGIHKREHGSCPERTWDKGTRI